MQKILSWLFVAALSASRGIVLASPDGASASVAVVTVPAPEPTFEPSFRNESDFRTSMLNSTNLFRYEHNATALAWNDSLEAYAQNWSSSCHYAHSGGPYGENIAIGFFNVTLTADAWGDERVNYSWAHPGFAESTGHFTQIVWKTSRTLGCGRQFCGNSGWYVVCEYFPPGNVIGEFGDEVQQQVNDGQGYSYANGSIGLNSGDAGCGPNGCTTSAPMPSSTANSAASNLRIEAGGGPALAAMGAFVLLTL